MADAYLYARVSHRDSLEHDSIDDQFTRMQEFATRIRPIPERLIADRDEAVSAYTKRFMSRQGVLRIVNNIKRGDYFVVDRFDRSWRTVKDFLDTVEWLNKRDVSLFIVDFRGQSVDMRDPHQRFYMTSLANHAELDSGLKSMRLRDTMSLKRKRGEKCGADAPLGMRFTHRNVDGQSRWYVEWDPRSRGVMQQIHEMRDKCGLGFRRIARLMNQYQFLYQQRGTPEEVDAMLADKRYKKPWSLHRVRRWYLRERFYKELAAKGITDIRDVCEAVRNLEANKSRDCAKTYKLTKASILPPDGKLETSLPDWIMKLGVDITDERERRRCFTANGTILEYMAAFTEQRDTTQGYREFHVDDCPLCNGKGICTTVAEEPYCFDNDDVVCEDCGYIGFMHVPEDGADASVQWADLDGGMEVE